MTAPPPKQRSSREAISTRYRDETIRMVIREWARIHRDGFFGDHGHYPGLRTALDALLEEYRER